MIIANSSWVLFAGIHFEYHAFFAANSSFAERVLYRNYLNDFLMKSILAPDAVNDQGNFFAKIYNFRVYNNVVVYWFFLSAKKNVNYLLFPF